VRRALVTGATGFVGSHVVRRLLADGVEVHALVRPTSDTTALLAAGAHLHVDDGGDLRGVVDAAEPDRCYHLATNFIAEHSPDQVAALVRDNVGFPARLADALARAGVVSFVNVGTAWQHVDGQPYRPKNLYAATKQAFEDVLTHYRTAGALQPVTVNLYDTYGPDDRRAKLLGALLDKVRTPGPPLAMSSGHQLIDLVHVDDVVDALLAAGEAGAATRYSASSGRPLTLRQLVDVVVEVAGQAVPVEWGARPDRAGDMTEHWDAGPPVPGWRPRISLEEGLASLLG
jgi:nucleoside-diphosphate-sugar epimerase